MAIGLTPSPFPQEIHPLSRGMESVRDQGMQQSCVVHAFATALEDCLRKKYDGIRIQWKQLVDALEKRKLDKEVYHGLLATEICNLILTVQDEDGKTLTVRMKRPLTEDEPCVRHSGDEPHVRYCSFKRVCAYMEATGFSCILTIMKEDYQTKQDVQHDICAVGCIGNLSKRDGLFEDKLLGNNSWAAQPTVLVNESIYRGHCEMDPVITCVQSRNKTKLAIPPTREKYEAGMEKWRQIAPDYPAKIEQNLYDRLASPEKTVLIMRVKELEEVLKQAEKVIASSSRELLEAIAAFRFHLKSLENELKAFRERLAMPALQEECIKKEYIQDQYTEAMKKWGQLEDKYYPKIGLPERPPREMLTERNLEARVKAVEEDLRQAQQAQKSLFQELLETTVESRNLQEKQGEELKRISEEVLLRYRSLGVHSLNEYSEVDISPDSRITSSSQNPPSPVHQNPPSRLPQDPPSPLLVSEHRTFSVSDRQWTIGNRAIGNIEKRVEACSEATLVSVLAEILKIKYGILIDETRLVHELIQSVIEDEEFHEFSLEEMCDCEIPLVDKSNQNRLTVRLSCLQIGNPTDNPCLKNSDIERIDALKRLDAYMKTTGLCSLVTVMSRDPEQRVDFQRSVCATSRIDLLGDKIVLLANKRLADLSTMAITDTMTITSDNYCGHIEMNAKVTRVQNIRDGKDLDIPEIKEEYIKRRIKWKEQLASEPNKAQIKRLTRKQPAFSKSWLGGLVTKAEEGVKQLSPSFGDEFSERQSVAVIAFCNEQVEQWAKVQSIWADVVWADVDRINEKMSSIAWNYIELFPPVQCFHPQRQSGGSI